MFRVSNRALAKLLAASNSCLSKKTHQVLLLFEPSRRPLTIQSSRFFANGLEKTTENHPLPVYQPDESTITHNPDDVSNKSRYHNPSYL